MSIVINIAFVLLAFATQIGFSSLTTTGVPLHILSILTVVCVWRQAPRAIAYRLLPAALCVDVVQPTHIPVTVLTVLAVWMVAALIQKHWLTNHSLASLAGIALLAIVVRLCVTWAGVGLGTIFGTSSITVIQSWTWRDNLLRLFIESSITIGLGAGWQLLHTLLRRSFLYAPR